MQPLTEGLANAIRTGTRASIHWAGKSTFKDSMAELSAGGWLLYGARTRVLAAQHRGRGFAGKRVERVAIREDSQPECSVHEKKRGSRLEGVAWPAGVEAPGGWQSCIVSRAF